MNDEKPVTIRDIAFLYQAALRNNFLPDVFMESMNQEMNQEMIKEHLNQKVKEVSEQMEIVNTLINGKGEKDKSGDSG